MVRTLLAMAVLASSALPAGAGDAPRELGDVAWMRDYDAALRVAGQSGKPVFALFQEVPGCATCIGFGDTVLSEPLFVEIIETEFVPLAVFNNEPGADARVLKRYGEPAWNNPVVRFLDSDGGDLIPRRDRVLTPREMGPRMLAALRAADRAVPGYAEIAVEETAVRSSGVATFSMPCFWRGEVCIGGIDGVVATTAGFLAGREVVEVRFDATAVTYPELLREVARAGCADGVFTHGSDQAEAAVKIFGAKARRASGRARDAGDDDQKYYLRRSPLRGLELGPTQATRVNAALGSGEDPARWLSPRQRARISPRRPGDPEAP